MLRFLVVLAVFLPFLNPPAIADEAFRREALPFPLESGRQITASVAVPVHATPGKALPVLLVFGGFENAGRVLDLVQPNSEVILASFDYPFDPPRKFSFPGSLAVAPQVKDMIRDTVEGIGILVKRLQARPDVDPRRIAIVGASLGSPFVLAAAAENPDLRWIAIVHGFGDIPATAAHQLLRAWQGKLGPLAFLPAALVATGAWFYLGAPSPERMAEALRPSQNVVMITADGDTFIPRKASESLWMAIERSEASRLRIRMPGDHLQPGSDQLISEIMKKIQNWLEKTGW